MRTRRTISLMLMAALLAACLAAALPAAALAVGDAPTITLGAGAITEDNRVYFGSYDDSPILWRVMGAGNDGGGNSKLLLSEYLLDDKQFDGSSPYSNAWQGSTARAWCELFYSKAFSAAEQSATVATTKNDLAYGGKYGTFGASTLNNEHVFFLSAQEAEEVYFPKGGSNEDRPRIAVPVGGGGALSWWLRSPYAYDDYLAGDVDGDGWVTYNNVGSTYGARPAFNFNLNSVLFSSSIPQNQSNQSNQYKLTLKDDKMSISSAGATREGTGYSVPYEITGDHKNQATRVSVIVTTKTWLNTQCWSSAGELLQYTELNIKKLLNRRHGNLCPGYDKGQRDLGHELPCVSRGGGCERRQSDELRQRARCAFDQQ